MTDASQGRFAEPIAASDDEVVTHSSRGHPDLLRSYPALVTLDNGRDHTRPSTLGPVTLVEFAATLDTLKERAA
jgi:hypothetical protein